MAGRALDTFDQVEIDRPEAEGAALDARQVEDVLDQPEQVAAAAADGVDQLLALGHALAAFLQQLRRADDAMQRRAQLVAHVGEEAAFRDGRRFGNLLVVQQVLRALGHPALDFGIHGIEFGAARLQLVEQRVEGAGQGDGGIETRCFSRLRCGRFTSRRRGLRAADCRGPARPQPAIELPAFDDGRCLARQTVDGSQAGLPSLGLRPLCVALDLQLFGHAVEPRLQGLRVEPRPRLQHGALLAGKAAQQPARQPCAEHQCRGHDERATQPERRAAGPAEPGACAGEGKQCQRLQRRLDAAQPRRLACGVGRRLIVCLQSMPPRAGGAAQWRRG